MGDHFHEADTLTHLGDAHHAAGEQAEAREDWQQALAILEDMQHPDDVRAKLAETDGQPRLPRAPKPACLDDRSTGTHC
jgi:hypothetical protein